MVNQRFLTKQKGNVKALKRERGKERKERQIKKESISGSLPLRCLLLFTSIMILKCFLLYSTQSFLHLFSLHSLTKLLSCFFSLFLLSVFFFSVSTWVTAYEMAWHERNRHWNSVERCFWPESYREQQILSSFFLFTCIIFCTCLSLFLFFFWFWVAFFRVASCDLLKCSTTGNRFIWLWFTWYKNRHVQFIWREREWFFFVLSIFLLSFFRFTFEIYYG